MKFDFTQPKCIFVVVFLKKTFSNVVCSLLQKVERSA